MNIFQQIINCLGVDNTERFFNLFKLFGAVITGVAGIVATALDKPGKKERPHPRTKLGRFFRNIFSKKWALRWAIIGVLIALLSQFGDTMTSTQQEREDQANQTNVLGQISLQETEASNSLEQIKRMATHFEANLSIEAALLLPPTNRWVQSLREAIELQPIVTNNPSGFFPFNAEKLKAIFNANRQFEDAANIISWLEHPDAVFGFDKNPISITATNTQHLDDLTNEFNFFVTSFKPSKTVVLYSQGTMLVSWTFEFPRTNIWGSDGAIVSTHDLQGAICYSEIYRDEFKYAKRAIFDNPLIKIEDSAGLAFPPFKELPTPVLGPNAMEDDGLYSHLQMVTLNVDFDDYPAIELREFMATGSNNIMESIFPKQKDF